MESSRPQTYLFLKVVATNNYILTHFISFAFSENIDFHFLPLQTKSAQDLVTWESLGGNTNIIKMEDDDDEDLSDHETTSQNVGFSR